MKTLQMIHYFNFVIATVFVVFYFYQIGYLLLGLLMKHRKNKTGSHQFHRYAAVISARNEANVIGGLIASLKAQNYPSDLLDIYVIADNCTDNTAQVAAQAGARVYRRYNHQQVGKGYALDYLFKCLSASGKDVYDGYFVFDADNYVDPDFVKEMNATFDSGHFAAITSYRNSKNFGDNWISAGYSIFFLREATQLNRARMMFGTSSCVSGTGFLFSSEIARENGGWKHFLLTEDFEFTVDRILKDDTVGYCENAIIYDEQPTRLGQSFMQRARWIKGYLQVFSRYGFKMLKKTVVDGSFACFDMIMNNIPCLVLTCASIVFNAIMVAAGVVTRTPDMGVCVLSVCSGIFGSILTLWFVGGITCITQRKRIRASTKAIFFGWLLFPLFIFTYAIAMVYAVFTNIEWKPIQHKVALSVEDLNDTTKK